MPSSSTWTHYVSRRFWRIYPAYIFSLIAFTIFVRRPFISGEFFYHALLIHNFKESTFFGQTNAVYWSLAVEVQFYALYPFALTIKKRLALNTFYVSAGCLAAIWVIGCYMFAP